jgi:hypothetical protein
MSNIAHFLTDDPDAKRLVAYGRDLFDGRCNYMHERVELAARRAGLPHFTNAYVEMAEDLGFDPHNDNVKCDFLLTQLKFADGLTVLRLFTYLFEEKIEPLVFDDEDIFYYILGRVGRFTAHQAKENRLVNQIMNEVRSIIEEIESEDR